MTINTLQFKAIALVHAIEIATGKSVDRIGQDDEGYIRVFFLDGSFIDRTEIAKFIGDGW